MNHGEEYTEKKPSASSTAPVRGLSVRKRATATGSCARWGKKDPGTAATASRSSSMSATRIEVSWRHAHRSQTTVTPPWCRRRSSPASTR